MRHPRSESRQGAPRSREARIRAQVLVTARQTARLERRQLIAASYHEHHRSRRDRNRRSSGGEVSLQRSEAKDGKADGDPHKEVTQHKGTNIGNEAWPASPQACGFQLERDDWGQ